MKNKEITIVGAGLYGCLTALKIKNKFKKIKINLVDANDDILNSLKYLYFENYKINNGFHAIDLPRAERLYNFLKNNLKIKFIKKKQKKFVIIDNIILDENFDINKVNYKIKRFFLEKNINTKNYNTIKKNISNKLIKILKLCSKRYCSNFADVHHLFFPWFLPKQYKYINKEDEGEIFRLKVRKELISSSYAFPKNYLFYSIKKKFKQKLEEKKINILCNSKIIFENNNLYLNEISKKKKIESDVVFLCNAPLYILKKSKSLIANLTQNKRFFVNLILKIDKNIDYFSEILCANKNFPELSRISFLKKDKSKTLLQLEIFLAEEKFCNKFFFNKRLKKFFFHLENFKVAKYKIVDFKITRNVFFPSKQIVDQSRKYIDDIVNLHKLKIKGYYPLLPINMAKAWLYSEKNLNYINSLYKRIK